MGFEKVMNRAIIGVAASALAFPGIAIAQSSKTVEFSSSFAPVTVTQDGVEVTLQPTEQDGLVAVAAAKARLTERAGVSDACELWPCSGIWLPTLPR